jgi:hypothetical protein
MQVGAVEEPLYRGFDKAPNSGGAPVKSRVVVLPAGSATTV